MANIETQLRDAAKASGLSIKALATRASVPYSAMHKFVNGYGDIILPTAAKVAEALGLELSPKPKPKRKGR